MSSKQWKPWSDTALCVIWPGSKLFAQSCLSKYLGKYSIKLTFGIPPLSKPVYMDKERNSFLPLFGLNQRMTKWWYCFVFFLANRIGYFLQIVSNGDNLHEMSNPVFWEQYFKMSAVTFSQSMPPLLFSVLLFAILIYSFRASKLLLHLCFDRVYFPQGTCVIEVLLI